MRKSRNYWTKERCLIEANKYKLRSKFKANSGGAYNASIKNGWLEEICCHMSVSGNKFRRLVYVYEFDDKTIYVGLTYNIDERDNKHRRSKKSPVYRYIKKTGLNPILSYSDYMDVWLSQKIEKEKIDFYKKCGYNVLNRAPAGGVGGGKLKWTKEKCWEEALKCDSRNDFYNKNNSAYNSARNNGWIDEICSHMPSIDKHSKGYWTKERCKEEAVKYKSKKKLYENNPGAYMSMLRNNWLNELCPHMNTKKPNGYWDKGRCKKEANKYKTRTDFRINSSSAYSSARTNGWLNEICSHMKK